MTLYVRVDIVPPPGFEGWNQEQEFTIVMKPDAPYRKFNIQYGINTPPHPYLLASAPVSLSSAREFPALKVPIMLHYSEGKIRLRAFTDREGKSKPRWEYLFPYNIPESISPPLEPNANWTSVSRVNDRDTKMVCALTLDQIVAEKWEFRGEINRDIAQCSHVIGTPPPLLVILGTRKVFKVGEGEVPMTYYGGRCVALVDISLYFAQDPFVQ